ncbi:hypothetical protein A5786_00005 [Gordonia sp. 852002-50816_SCH5313054-a]|nr:hypothetical protein A5786_00005 [Gordonia sp. 852002-50816_SCH5313054-a]
MGPFPLIEPAASGASSRVEITSGVAGFDQWGEVVSTSSTSGEGSTSGGGSTGEWALDRRVGARPASGVVSTSSTSGVHSTSGGGSTGEWALSRRWGGLDKLDQRVGARAAGVSRGSPGGG